MKPRPRQKLAIAHYLIGAPRASALLLRAIVTDNGEARVIARTAHAKTLAAGACLLRRYFRRNASSTRRFVENWHVSLPNFTHYRRNCDNRNDEYHGDLENVFKLKKKGR